MKKNFILIIFIAICYSTSISQTCLPDGITFTSQTEIDSFQYHYPNCTKIEGSIRINDSVDGNINNLIGLSVLNRLGSQVNIENNDSLITLEGLENIDSIGLNLIIYNNKSLVNISHLESLSYVKGVIIIEKNASLLTLEGLENFDTIRLLNIIENESLEHLHNLSNLKAVRTELLIENNQSINNLSGLENVTYVGEDLKIFDMDLLNDLQGLNNLAYAQWLKVRYNDNLTSLDGLDKLDTIVGLSINDNPKLFSMESIANTHINWFAHLEDNNLLDVCNIKSICELIATADPDYVIIQDNAQGCNSVEEVQELCLLDIPNKNDVGLLEIYPNPTGKYLYITGIDHLSIDKVSIYNTYQQIALKDIKANKIDISNLKQGIYIIEVLNEGKIYRNKFIKN